MPSCPTCDTEVTRIVNLRDWKTDTTLVQDCIDILSVSNIDSSSRIDVRPDLIPNLAEFAFNFLTRCSHPQTMARQVLEMNNMKLHVNGYDRMRTQTREITKLIYVVNHTSILDFFVLVFLLRDPAFVVSSEVRDSWIGRHAMDIVRFIVVDRGKSGCGTVEAMRAYLSSDLQDNDKKSVCVFPEGMMTHPEALIRFRSGAFHVGAPIVPVVIKYSKHIVDSNDIDFALKILSGFDLDVNVSFLDVIATPSGDEASIEAVRMDMCRVGKLMLSRVSNRDICDT